MEIRPHRRPTAHWTTPPHTRPPHRTLGDPTAHSPTLNGPQSRNALSTELRRRFFTALRDAETDETVDVVIVTGADPVFCAGLDLKELGDTTELPDISPKWLPMTKPVIDAINGAAVTGGLELALYRDILIASDRARFADTYARVGLLPAWGVGAAACRRWVSGWPVG